MSAHFNGHDFFRAQLASAAFSNSVLRDCNFDHAIAPGAQFVDATLEDSSAQGADFSHANFSGAKLTETVFSRADLRHATLDSAQGDGVVFRGANLAGASLRHVNLLTPDFRGADLTETNFSGATLRGPDFRGAILDRVIWDGVSITGARFDADAQPAADAPHSAPTMDGAFAAVQDLIRQAIADPRLAGLEGVAPVDPALLLASLKEKILARGVDVSAELLSFEQILKILQSSSGDEPPEEWKAWLEELMRNSPPEIAVILSDAKRNA